jgi:hypothetical protein
MAEKSIPYCVVKRVETGNINESTFADALIQLRRRHKVRRFLTGLDARVQESYPASQRGDNVTLGMLESIGERLKGRRSHFKEEPLHPRRLQMWHTAIHELYGDEGVRRAQNGLAGYSQDPVQIPVPALSELTV